MRNKEISNSDILYKFEQQAEEFVVELEAGVYDETLDIIKMIEEV